MTEIPVTIREVEQRDAEALLNLRLALDRETAFMMLEPGERATDIAGQRSEIQRLQSRENAAMLVAEVDGQLAGLLEIDGGTFRRNRHSAAIVVGVLQAFSGRGIGTRLFETAETWAHLHSIHRLELTVMTHNAAAVTLYTRLGFEIEGARRDSLLVSGRYVDEYLMAKLLP